RGYRSTAILRLSGDEPRGIDLLVLAVGGISSRQVDDSLPGSFGHRTAGHQVEVGAERHGQGAVTPQVTQFDQSSGLESSLQRAGGGGQVAGGGVGAEGIAGPA